MLHSPSPPHSHFAKHGRCVYATTDPPLPPPPPPHLPRKALNYLSEKVKKWLRFTLRESQSRRKRVKNPELQNLWFWSVTLLLIESLTRWKIDLAAVQNRCDVRVRPQRPLRETERVRSGPMEQSVLDLHTQTHLSPPAELPWCLFQWKWANLTCMWTPRLQSMWTRHIKTRQSKTAHSCIYMYKKTAKLSLSLRA